MSIKTVGGLVTALKKHNQALPLEALDEGSDTRDFQAFRVVSVGEETVGNDATGNVKTVFVRVAPKA